jgi:hypothetical protein
VAIDFFGPGLYSRHVLKFCAVRQVYEHVKPQFAPHVFKAGLIRGGSPDAQAL